jgi:hypothetical protein
MAASLAVFIIHKIWVDTMFRSIDRRNRNSGVISRDENKAVHLLGSMSASHLSRNERRTRR